MIYMYDPSGLDGLAVRLRGGRNLSRTLCLREPVSPYADVVIDYLVEVQDSGLQVSIGVTSLGGDGLPGFLRGLSDDYRGWAGTRQWRSLEDQLVIEASHDGQGHVTLMFRLCERIYGDHWDLRVPFTVEAGAEMAALADAVEVFFASALP
ncbi:MAG TPA: hypothetical protein DHU96_14420 [Actinobacteria bacterium]|nr:hypothetical protein [Actinomycetota bacterium]